MRSNLRSCPRCREIRRFDGDNWCRRCGRLVSDNLIEDHPVLESVRCRTCGRVVVATLDGKCGRCSARNEYLERRRLGILSGADRYERRVHVKV